jgi:thiosulfate reductase cytochrome b subunit
MIQVVARNAANMSCKHRIDSTDRLHYVLNLYILNPLVLSTGNLLMVGHIQSETQHPFLEQKVENSNAERAPVAEPSDRPDSER